MKALWSSGLHGVTVPYLEIQRASSRPREVSEIIMNACRMMAGWNQESCCIFDFYLILEGTEEFCQGPSSGVNVGFSLKFC